MNTKKNSNLRGMGVYVVLVLAVVFIWFFLSQNTASNSYTKTDFENMRKCVKRELELRKIYETTR